MKNKYLLLVLILITIIVVFFWPSLYHYETLKLGENSFPVRINRFTGFTSYFNKEWLAQTNSLSKTIPLADISNLVLTPTPSTYEEFSGILYNGTEWAITKVHIKLSMIDEKDSIIWERRFNVPVSIEPFTTQSFSYSILEGKDFAKEIYTILSDQYDLGAIDIFMEKIKIPEKRHIVYDNVSKSYNVGDFASFEKVLTQSYPHRYKCIIEQAYGYKLD